MLRLVFILVSLLGIAWAVVPCLAQETSPEKPQHPLRPGVWALELQVQPGSSGGIAAKRHFSTRSALRFGTLVSLRNDDEDGTMQREDIDLADTTTSVAPFSTSDDTRDVTLFGHYLRFLGVSERFGMSVETGPTVRWRSTESTLSDARFSPDVYYADYETNTWYIGMDLQAGFEWFFSHKLSLSGRYGVTAVITDTDRTEETIYSLPSIPAWSRRLITSHEEGYQIQTTPAVISLTAYF